MTETAAQQVTSLSRRRSLIGFTSYMMFPKGYESSFGEPYEKACVAWCHCFRHPQEYFTESTPRILLSHSDFTDYAQPGLRVDLPATDAHKVYDFIYVGDAAPWPANVKNWPLADRCIERLCAEGRFEGIVVGHPPTSHLSALAKQVIFVPTQPWIRLMSLISRSRLMLVPNELDPSPRILAEALCLDVPILVNRNILGGWKYVTPFTGAFFDDEHSVVEGALSCLCTRGSPRRWFIANHGPINAGRRLAALIGKIDKRFEKLRNAFVVPKYAGAKE